MTLLSARIWITTTLLLLLAFLDLACSFHFHPPSLRNTASTAALGASKKSKSGMLPYDKIVKQLKFHTPNFDAALADVVVDTCERAIKEWSTIPAPGT